jgi:hypothetical protein
MAFVRKVRTSSGATAVQVVRKERGELIIVQHLGSAKTPEKIERLVQEGRKILIGEDQKALFNLKKFDS